VKLSKVVLTDRPSGKAMPVAQSAVEVTSTKTGFCRGAKLAALRRSRS